MIIDQSIQRSSPHVKGISSITKGTKALPVLVSKNMSDAGNAECLAEYADGQMLFCHTRKKWFVWDGVRWREDDCGLARQSAVMVARARQNAALRLQDIDARSRLMKWALSSESSQRVEATLRMTQVLDSVAVTIDRFDKDPLLAATQNGTLDLHSGSFGPSRPQDRLTMQLGTLYEPEATAPRWRRFLDEIFKADQELISFIQRAVGYSLTGETGEQVMFLCIGSGANGKSVFLDTLSKLLGDYAATASFETFDAGKRNEASNDLAALRGKRLVTVIETDEDRRLAEAKVKAVTGQDSISCRFLYGEFFTYRPQFKIWMAMNHLPVIRGTDNGIWRRLRIIPFTQSFEGHADKRLGERLQAELPGIMSWALDGLRDWQKNGLGMPQAIKTATENFRAESDSIGLWIQECTVRDSTASMPAGAGYAVYRQWAQERGERPYGNKKWSQSLTEKGFEKAHGRDGNIYKGLDICSSK